MALTRRNVTRIVLWTAACLFVLLNTLAFFHAYRFTHFSEEGQRKTKDPAKLSLTEKLNTLAFGVKNPRPFAKRKPSQKYTTLRLQSNVQLECWLIEQASSKGTVVLFHGYSGEKSRMLDRSDVFLKMGYNTLLVDFMGSGGSEGNQTTIGAKEAENVKTALDYLQQQGEKNIFLFGTSMGAVAILKALHDYPLQPTAIVVECPYGSLYETTCARFRTLGVPTFPLAGLLDFWGGVQNGFCPFSIVPIEYATSIKCPTLLLYGEQDDKVSRWEIDRIYENLQGKKVLKTYPMAGHVNYLKKYRAEWTKDVGEFLENSCRLPVVSCQ